MLRVSDNRRFLVHDDGTPFFYLADTGWALLQRLTLAETERYLRDRAAKGFTAIQVVGISEFDGLSVPNQNGDLPLIDQNRRVPTTPTGATSTPSSTWRPASASGSPSSRPGPTRSAPASGAPTPRSSPPRTPAPTASTSANGTATSA